MLSLRSPHSLRRVLTLDAVTCSGMGAVLVLGSGPIGTLTEIPPALLHYAGVSLFPIAAFVAVIGLRPAIGSAGVWLVIAGNAGWVMGSALLLITSWIEPNMFGVIFLATQALAVAMLAWLEFAALRRDGHSHETSRA